MKSFNNLKSIEEVADYLKISVELVMKFIDSGIVKTVIESSHLKLNQYNFRRLCHAIELYEQCFPYEVIENALNN